LLRDLKPLNKFTISFGAVCRTNVQMTCIPYAHQKPQYDKRVECLNFLDLGAGY